MTNTPGRPARKDSRNGTKTKTVITKLGPIEIDVPRDRDGRFTPATVRKRQRRLEGVDAMCYRCPPRALTTREILAHLAEVYRAAVSKEKISMITDTVSEKMAWVVRRWFRCAR